MRTLVSPLAAAILFLLLVIGCGTPSERPNWHVYDGCRTFVVSQDFPPAERAAIYRAVERWNAIAIEQLCIVDANPDLRYDQHAIFRIEYGGEYYRRIAAQEGEFYGIYFERADIILLIDSLAAVDFEIVVLHEFGHTLLGKQHIAPPAIMSKYHGSASDFTENDLAECFRVHACKPDASVAPAQPAPAPDDAEVSTINVDPCTSHRGDVPVLCRPYDRVHDDPYPLP